ncbi:MAG: radical SAM protein [Fibrobacteria bacterium]|nr:radical SAM protein [Fibrobacteria bacterium]
MKVLFIYTDINTRGSAKHLQIGIASLSSVLRQKSVATKLLYLIRYDFESVKKTIVAFKPDIVAFTSVGTQFRHVVKIAAYVKSTFDIFAICGGPHVSLVPDVLEQSPFDAICRGEGEFPLAELVEKMSQKENIYAIKNLWFKKDGIIIKNETRPFIDDLDSLPFPDRDIFDYQNVIDSDYGQASFMFSRGCPFNCPYCSNHALRKLAEGKYVRTRSVAEAIQEIRDVRAQYTFNEVVFDDDTMTINKKWLMSFLDVYVKKISIPFEINARVDTMDNEILEKLKMAGCRKISFGIESGNEELRQRILKRKMTNELIINYFEKAKSLGIKTKSFNLVGLPYENREKFKDTISINAAINPDSLILNVFYPYQGTDLFKLCKEQNWLGPEPETFVERDDTILELPDFSRKEIIHCYKTFGFKVYQRYSLWKAFLYYVRYSRLGEIILALSESMLLLGGKKVKIAIKKISGT